MPVWLWFLSSFTVALDYTSFCIDSSKATNLIYCAPGLCVSVCSIMIWFDIIKLINFVVAYCCYSLFKLSNRFCQLDRCSLFISFDFFVDPEIKIKLKIDYRIQLLCWCLLFLFLFYSIKKETVRVCFCDLEHCISFFFSGFLRCSFILFNGLMWLCVWLL